VGNDNPLQEGGAKKRHQITREKVSSKRKKNVSPGRLDEGGRREGERARGGSRDRGEEIRTMWGREERTLTENPKKKKLWGKTAENPCARIDV